MMDGEKLVAVRVSSEALQDRAAKDGRHNDDIIDLFRDYRSEVEVAASRKYDECPPSEGRDLMIIADDLT
jgi:hypothetical protein